MNRAAILFAACALAIIIAVQGRAPLTAQQPSTSMRAADAREALQIARTQQRSAKLRAERLESEAERAGTGSRNALSAAAAQGLCSWEDSRGLGLGIDLAAGAALLQLSADEPRPDPLYGLCKRGSSRSAPMPTNKSPVAAAPV